ncbi:hypothetical protein B0I35DRAFT_111698 [Stachybotrys elegans]|uniref:Clr5 domain-containing protein n=1 Tax=Stachybotrys elegans TaxID=80388 RepID=A0A8K0SFZ2_9HYPO|nr:hypothetical protein B0I35DRAFT_111698 [Stachybotrys elegans]
MSFRREKIPHDEWEEHKSEISRLFAASSLKNVQQQMLDLYNFDASISQYESRLRLWGIRKNRKKREWEELFSGESSLSPSAIQRQLPPVLRRDAGATIKRAKRWAGRSSAYPDTITAFATSEASVDTHQSLMEIDITVRSPSPGLGQMLDSVLRYTVGPQFIAQCGFMLSSGPMSPRTISCFNQASSSVHSSIFNRTNTFASFSISGLTLPFFELENSLKLMGIDFSQLYGHASSFINTLRDRGFGASAEGSRNRLLRLGPFIPTVDSTLTSMDGALEANFVRSLLWCLLNDK